jgi:L-threonine kinase
MESLGPPPPVCILVLDFGGEVDTLAFNAVDRTPQLAVLEAKWREALALVREGLRHGDASLIARGATLSAVTHQELAPHPRFGEAMAFARKEGAFGVNIAHSGTVIGLLFADDAARVATAKDAAEAHLRGLQRAFATQLVGVRA